MMLHSESNLKVKMSRDERDHPELHVGKVDPKSWPAKIDFPGLASAIINSMLSQSANTSTQSLLRTQRTSQPHTNSLSTSL